MVADPIVLAHARALLVSGGQGTTDYIDADLRAPETILERAAQTLDFSRPVAVLLFAVLHAVRDEENPHAIVARLMDAVPSGSYLALTHLGAEFFSAETMAQMEQMGRAGSRQQYASRSEADVRRFFDGLELVPPGLVAVEDWRRDPGTTPTGDAALWAGVALKPWKACPFAKRPGPGPGQAAACDVPAACRPARRPEKMQSARDSPLM